MFRPQNVNSREALKTRGGTPHHHKMTPKSVIFGGLGWFYPQ